MNGKLRPRFPSPLTDLEREDPGPEGPEYPVGTPLCPRCGAPDLVGVEWCRLCGMSMAKAKRYGVEGPTEGVWTTPGPHGTLIYEPLRDRSTAFRAVLMLGVMLSAVNVVLYLAYYAGIEPAIPNLPIANETLADWIDRLRVVLVFYVVLVCLCAAWWTSRAYGNLLPMQVRGLRLPVGFAKVTCAIPIVNVWVSKLIVDDLYRASDPQVGFQSESWKKRPVPLHSTVGWVGLIAALLLLPLSAVTFPETVLGNEGALRLALIMGVLGYLSFILGLGSFAVLVLQITDRQEARVDRLGTSPRPSAWKQRAMSEEQEAREEDEASEAVQEAIQTGRLQERSPSSDALWESRY